MSEDARTVFVTKVMDIIEEQTLASDKSAEEMAAMHLVHLLTVAAMVAFGATAGAMTEEAFASRACRVYAVTRRQCLEKNL